GPVHARPAAMAVLAHAVLDRNLGSPPLREADDGRAIERVRNVARTGSVARLAAELPEPEGGILPEDLRVGRFAVVPVLLGVTLDAATLTDVGRIRQRRLSLNDCRFAGGIGRSGLTDRRRLRSKPDSSQQDEGNGEPDARQDTGHAQPPRFYECGGAVARTTPVRTRGVSANHKAVRPDLFRAIPSSSDLIPAPAESARRLRLSPPHGAPPRSDPALRIAASPQSRRRLASRSPKTSGGWPAGDPRRRVASRVPARGPARRAVRDRTAHRLATRP